MIDGRVINMTEVSIAVHASHATMAKRKDLCAEAHSCAKADVLAGCEQYNKDGDYQALALSIVDRAFAGGTHLLTTVTQALTIVTH